MVGFPVTKDSGYKLGESKAHTSTVSLISNMQEELTECRMERAECMQEFSLQDLLFWQEMLFRPLIYLLEG